jgi:hypothetical protein
MAPATVISSLTVTALFDCASAIFGCGHVLFFAGVFLFGPIDDLALPRWTSARGGAERQLAS